MSRVVAAVMIAGAVTGAVAAAPVHAVTPEEAIAEAVRRVIGAPVPVTIVGLDTKVVSEPGLTAEPEAAARFAKPARFALSANGVRRGMAVATVRTTARLAQAARAIGRDEPVARDAVQWSLVELPAVRIRPLLVESDIVGRTARRAIAEREPLTMEMLSVPPLVRSGDEVEVTVSLGRVRVTGAGRASGSGHRGEIIRIAPPNSLRLLRARITGPGAVEIVE